MDKTTVTGATVTRQAAASDRLSPLGRLLRGWRQARSVSQLALAAEADTTQKYLSFIESGRARPSREMVLRLAVALDVPLRDRNQLLVAAGYAPLYLESSLDGPALAQVRTALEMLLHHSEPQAAIAVDRNWNLLMTNRAAMRLFSDFLEDADLWATVSPGGEQNLLRLLFHPAGLKRYIVNWEEVALATLDRARRENDSLGGNDALTALLDDLVDYEGIPERWRAPDWEAPPRPHLPVVLVKDNIQLTFVTLISTFGTPQDITLQELRIETFLPADEATSAYMQRLATTS